MSGASSGAGIGACRNTYRGQEICGPEADRSDAALIRPVSRWAASGWLRFTQLTGNPSLRRLFLVHRHDFSRSVRKRGMQEHAFTRAVSTWEKRDFYDVAGSDRVPIPAAISQVQWAHAFESPEADFAFGVFYAERYPGMRLNPFERLDDP